VHVRHHLAHAASAYYLSGFDEALVLVADGMGETDSITVFHGVGAHL
jgi:carbamoyltransferase